MSDISRIIIQPLQVTSVGVTFCIEQHVKTNQKGIAGTLQIKLIMKCSLSVLACLGGLARAGMLDDQCTCSMLLRHVQTTQVV